MDVLKVGDKVTVDFKDSEQTAMNLRKYRGQSFEISRIMKWKSDKVYELADVESDYGIPYVFAEDWLKRAEA